MGIVYLAEQQGRLRRRVALKVIAAEFSQDATYRRRFEREAQHAASLDHPNVVPVFEAGEEKGNLFLAMRYVDGLDLAAILRERDRLDPAGAASVIAQTAAALDSAHANGLVHRDVKPANILCVGGDVAGHVYLTDFGLTRQGVSSSGLTNTGRWVGTVDYVAPEQIQRGRIDARTDVYGLGCVLFHLLSGHPPYDGDDLQKMWAQVHDDPPTLAPVGHELARAFDPVIARAMAQHPDDRYPSAGDLGRAGIAAAEGSSITVPERTVATGVAASGVKPGQSRSSGTSDLDSTREMKPPLPPPRRPPARTAVMADGQAAKAKSGPPIVRIAAAVALVAAVAVGAAIGASVLSNSGNGDSSGSASSAESIAQPDPETSTVTTTTEQAGPRSSYRAIKPSSYAFYAPGNPKFAYVASLPAGNGWSEPQESLPAKTLLRTTVDGPEDAFIFIDRTPKEEPTLSGGFDSSTTISQPAFGSATEYSLSSNQYFTECNKAPCVDIQFKDGLGGGWAILAEAPTHDAATTVARKVAESISLGD